MLEHVTGKFDEAGLQLFAREIRAARTRMGWTLSDLASAVGLDKGYLSKVERGIKAPSLATVLNLARALKVPIGQLFGEAIDDSVIQVSRADRRRPFQADEVSGYSMSALTNIASGIDGLILSPGPEFLAESLAEHDGEELLFVLNGAVEIRFKDRIIALNQADAIRFPGRLQHQVRRKSESATVLIAVARG